MPGNDISKPVISMRTGEIMQDRSTVALILMFSENLKHAA